MKHTQGQWTAFDHDGFAVTNGDTVICIAGETDLDENEANANLIASAPELLQALMDMQRMVGFLGWTPPSAEDDKDESKKIVCNAIDVIAKAGGK